MDFDELNPPISSAQESPQTTVLTPAERLNILRTVMQLPWVRALNPDLTRALLEESEDVFIQYGRSAPKQLFDELYTRWYYQFGEFPL
jgi:hypothetical protein